MNNRELKAILEHRSDSMRTVLEIAQQEASRLRHDYVGTEHLLLNLIQDVTVASILYKLQASPERVRAAVESKSG